MAWYIHSTCGQSQVFKFFEKIKKDSTISVSKPRVGKDGKPLEIRIGGGAYVLLRDQGVTRKVMITEVTDEQLELLHSHPAYMRMKDRGFFTERHENTGVYDQVSGNPQDMQKRDNTAQISDHDHAKGLDERVNHAGTRATTGINNQEGGQQPLAAEDGNYGPIHL